MPSHWEGGLIMCINNRSALGTLVELTIRLAILVKLEGTTATAVAVGFSGKRSEVQRALRLSMTHNEGRETVKLAETPQRAVPLSTLLTRTALGIVFLMRIPMAFTANTYRRASICRCTATKNSMPLLIR